MDHSMISWLSHNFSGKKHAIDDEAGFVPQIRNVLDWIENHKATQARAKRETPTAKQQTPEASTTESMSAEQSSEESAGESEEQSAEESAEQSAEQSAGESATKSDTEKSSAKNDEVPPSDNTDKQTESKSCSWLALGKRFLTLLVPC